VLGALPLETVARPRPCQTSACCLPDLHHADFGIRVLELFHLRSPGDSIPWAIVQFYEPDRRDISARGTILDFQF